MRRFRVVPLLLPTTALLLACGGAAETRGETTTSPANDHSEDANTKETPAATRLPSRDLVRRLMTETGASGEAVLKALYPLRDKLNEHGELSEEDFLKVGVQLATTDSRLADRIARGERNAMLDMERYIRKRTRGDCEGVSDGYGFDRETPLQVGRAAAGSQLFMGTLICPANRLAKIKERSSGATGKYKRPNQDNTDLPLDTWTVQCGPKTYTIYSDVYTRGRFCAPNGFEIVPLRAREAYGLSWDAFKKKEFEDALTLVNEAIDKGGPVAEFLEHRAFIELELGKTKAARTTLRSALRASPQHEGIALNWAGVEFHQGTPRQADAAFKQVLKTIPPSHQNYRLAWCMAAETKAKLRSRKERARGRQMAKEGCAANDEGNERCCAMQAANDVDDVSE